MKHAKEIRELSNKAYEIHRLKAIEFIDNGIEDAAMKHLHGFVVQGAFLSSYNITLNDLKDYFNQLEEFDYKVTWNDRYDSVKITWKE